MSSLGGLKALTNGNMKIHKVLTLPSFLEEDSIYFVKNGVGADLYMVSNDGDAIKVSSGVDYGLTLGESNTTAYQGDRGKFAYDHAQSPHVENQTDIGLGHVNNTSDLNKPVSTATQAALDALTKTDVGLGDVDNTSDIDKPVSTLQQAAIDASGGGDSFDQDLNTTDSPTFVTLTTTDTIATDVYAVDVGATGTVTAGEVTTDTFQVASGGYAFKSGVTQIASFYPGSATIRGSIIPGVAGIYDLGTSGARWDDLFVERVDASGTVTAGEVTTESGVFNTPTVGSQYALEVQSSGTKNFTINGFGTVESKTMLPRSNAAFNFGSSGQRWKEVFTGDIDATGTVTAGGFVGTPQTLTDAATITYDLASGHNSKVTITADRTLALPTNLAEGASGVLTLTQDGTGGHALALASGWFVSAGALADITALAANEKAQITWYAYSATNVNATILPLQ